MAATVPPAPSRTLPASVDARSGADRATTLRHGGGEPHAAARRRTRPDWSTTTGRDGTRLGWRRSGRWHPGAIPVVLCNGIACSVDYWTELLPHLEATRTVVQWDYRGHGASGVPAERAAVTIDDVMDDLDAVLHAAEVTRAVFVGHSFGVQVALEAARRWPQRVAAVVAVAGAPGAPLPARAARPLHAVERLHARMPERTDAAWRRWWHSPLTRIAAHAIGGTSRAAPRPIMLAYYEHVSTRDVPLLLAMMRAMQEHDASDVPASLTVPLLVLAGDADRLTPLPVMAGLALAAPDGELVIRHGATHTLPAEHPRWVWAQLRGLLARVDAEPGHVDVPAGA